MEHAERIIALLERNNELLEKLAARQAAPAEPESPHLAEARRLNALGRFEETRALFVAAGKVKPKRQYKRKEVTQ